MQAGVTCGCRLGSHVVAGWGHVWLQVGWKWLRAVLDRRLQAEMNRVAGCSGRRAAGVHRVLGGGGPRRRAPGLPARAPLAPASYEATRARSGAGSRHRARRGARLTRAVTSGAEGRWQQGEGGEGRSYSEAAKVRSEAARSGGNPTRLAAVHLRLAAVHLLSYPTELPPSLFVLTD